MRLSLSILLRYLSNQGDWSDLGCFTGGRWLAWDVLGDTILLMILVTGMHSFLGKEYDLRALLRESS